MWTCTNDADPRLTDVRSTDPASGDQIVVATFASEHEAWDFLVAHS